MSGLQDPELEPDILPIDDNFIQENTDTNLFSYLEREVQSSNQQSGVWNGTFLSIQSENFRNEFYSKLTNRKKFKKDYIVKIHNTILAPKLGFRSIKRDEIRNIKNYFINYTRMSQRILEVLEKNKEMIKKSILSDNY